MLYKEIAPKQGLKRIIKCFWILEHDYREAFQTHEHLWADAHAELIFTSGKPYYLKTRSGRQHLPKNFVIGPFKHESKLYSDGLTRFVAIRFQAWGIYPFSVKPMSSLVNNILSAEEIFGNEIPAIAARINKEKENEEKIRLLQEHFRSKLIEIGGAKLLSRPIASEIIADKGVVSVSDLSKQFGLSLRHLQRIFKAETGMSPKVFSRIVRFNHARQLIEQNPDIDLSQVTYETGYTDQSHFSKNFRELFNISPADFKRQLKEFMNDYAKNNMNVAFLQDE